MTAPDNRWGRVDIKTIGLLPNVLARQSAKDSGAREAWFVDENGLVTEGTSSNAWIVTKEGKLVTRPSSHRILTGITLTVLKTVAAKEGVMFEERAFSVSEALAAREAFITSATQNRDAGRDDRWKARSVTASPVRSCDGSAKRSTQWRKLARK